MAAIVQSPLLFGSDAIELSGGVWRKRVLPVGSISYQGRVLKFDKDYLSTLAEAFNRNAYDQVPFQLATDENKHTNNPDRTRGWVTGMSVTDDGLWVEVETTPEGNTLLSSNPRLGVSARIVEDYARADGQYYPAAVQHVLGTLDPRITSLGAWQPVDMSNAEADMVIDLSAESWAGEPAYEFADGGHPLAPKLRKLSRTLAARHPELGASQHVDDAADAMDMGMHDAAKRHLRAAIGNFTPQSLTRHGVLSDDDHNQAKASMDEVHRHLLMVQQDQDEQGDQATDQQPDVKARADVTQPVPTGSQRMGTYANDGDETTTGGLTPHGKEIYKKLTAKGLSPAVAMAMARRAQRVQPGAQLANTDFSEPGAALEMAYAQAQQRDAEDRDRPMRRTGGTSGISEDRLAYALGRISRGSYMPTQPQIALGFAGGDGYDYGAYGQGCDCGATADDGRTVSTTHLAGCGFALSSDEQAGFVTAGVYAAVAAEPFTDANDRTWNDQHGAPMTLAGHVEAATGLRVRRDSPFEADSHAELSAPQRVTRFGDYDDDADPGAEMSAGSQRAVAALRGAMGLPDQAAAREAKRDTAFMRMVQRPGLSPRTFGQKLEQGESTRQRAERFRVPVTPATATLVGWNDGCHLPGELGTLSYG